MRASDTCTSTELLETLLGGHTEELPVAVTLRERLHASLESATNEEHETAGLVAQVLDASSVTALLISNDGF